MAIIFDNFELHDKSRKLSSSSHESSISSCASSGDYGFSVSEDFRDKNKSSDKTSNQASSSIVQKNLELHLRYVELSSDRKTEM